MVLNKQKNAVICEGSKRLGRITVQRYLFSMPQCTNFVCVGVKRQKHVSIVLMNGHNMLNADRKKKSYTCERFCINADMEVK